MGRGIYSISGVHKCLKVEIMYVYEYFFINLCKVETMMPIAFSLTFDE